MATTTTTKNKHKTIRTHRKTKLKRKECKKLSWRKNKKHFLDKLDKQMGKTLKTIAKANGLKSHERM